MLADDALERRDSAILMTSAPKSATNLLANGAAMKLPSPMTRTPCSGAFFVDIRDGGSLGVEGGVSWSAPVNHERRCRCAESTRSPGRRRKEPLRPHLHHDASSNAQARA